MKINFKNKIAVVVGSSKGIGLGVADKFEELGAKVIRVSRKEGVDISDKNSIDSFFESITDIDFLINVAGINFCKKIEDIEMDEWDSVIDTNLRSFYYRSVLTYLAVRTFFNSVNQVFLTRVQISNTGMQIFTEKRNWNVAA